MTKTVIAVDGAPRPFAGAPYNQAIAANGFVFCAGQVPLDPGSGTLVEGDIAAQTDRVLQSLRAVLEGAGSGLDRVVKTTVFMTDLGEFGAMNEVYATYFTSDPPARSTIQVAGLPAGARVEIEAIAIVDG
ncbi:MAG TPA: Rid family detoxifying hydrolase [Gaiellales bacterium]